MRYCVKACNLQGRKIILPASKSISNRLLIMNALSGKEGGIENLAECDDTEVLLRALNGSEEVTDVHGAGTAMRFLTAYYSCRAGIHVLTGSKRMQERPIGVLVEALRETGADICYEKTEGFPPLRIRGKMLQGGSVTMRGDISSQYVSALLLIAPYMRKGLRLRFSGRVLSEPYIRMTIELMRSYGASVKWDEDGVIVAPGCYRPTLMRVEGDWSAASYWYEIAALSRTEFTLCGLQRESLQGDARIAEYFKDLGIHTVFTAEGVRLSPVGERCAFFTANLSNEPDIAQTMALTCALLEIPFRIEGLYNLRIKETDRISALQNEAYKLGYLFTAPSEGVLMWDGRKISSGATVCIRTYDDHRMAMAFAPVALCREAVIIDEPEVVIKSYPEYWAHLHLAGFDLTGMDGEKEVI